MPRSKVSVRLMPEVQIYNKQIEIQALYNLSSRSYPPDRALKLNASSVPEQTYGFNRMEVLYIKSWWLERVHSSGGACPPYRYSKLVVHSRTEYVLGYPYSTLQLLEVQHGRTTVTCTLATILPGLVRGTTPSRILPTGTSRCG